MTHVLFTQQGCCRVVDEDKNSGLFLDTKSLVKLDQTSRMFGRKSIFQNLVQNIN